MRHFTESTLLIASHNNGKVAELQQLFVPHHIKLISAAALNIPEPEETGSSFVENAVLKARYYSAAAGMPALADDSGLAVAALDGAPGIYSARWAGESKDFSMAMQKIEQLMAGKDDRRAAFICALALCWPDGHLEEVEGRVDGQLSFPPRGEKGFGYDPIFMPQGYDLTFAEMPAAEKNALSHRADAFAKLIEQCF